MNNNSAYIRNFQEKNISYISNNAYKKQRQYYRNKAIASGLRQYSQANGYHGLFLTMTCEKYSDKIMSRHEINSKFQKIRQSLKRDNIQFFGVKSLEKHENGNCHAHIILYCLPDDVENAKIIYKKYFSNDVNLNDEAIKLIEISGSYSGLEDYIIWISHINEDDDNYIITKSEKSDVTFFGLKKDFLKTWDYVYKSKRSLLSQSEWMAKRAIRNKQYGEAIAQLEAISDYNKNAVPCECEQVSKIPKKLKKPIESRYDETWNIYKPRLCQIRYYIIRGPPYNDEIYIFVRAISIFSKKGAYRMTTITNTLTIHQKKNYLTWVRGPPKN